MGGTEGATGVLEEAAFLLLAPFLNFFPSFFFALFSAAAADAFAAAAAFAVPARRWWSSERPVVDLKFKTNTGQESILCGKTSLYVPESDSSVLVPLLQDLIVPGSLVGHQLAELPLVLWQRAPPGKEDSIPEKII